MSKQLQTSGTKLILEHRSALYGYLFACVRNHADAEDLFQDVSVAVIESLDQLTDVSGFLPWAREIAFRRVMEHVRKTKRERPIDPHLVAGLVEASERVESMAPSASRRVALMECLEQLPLAQRNLIVRRYQSDSGAVGEIAKSLGMTVQAVYARLKRIKVALRNCVSRRLAGEHMA